MYFPPKYNYLQTKKPAPSALNHFPHLSLIKLSKLYGIETAFGL